MNKKGTRTSVIAIIGLALSISVFVFRYIGTIDNEGLVIGLAGVTTMTTTIIGIFAKDADKSHTHD